MTENKNTNKELELKQEGQLLVQKAEELKIENHESMLQANNFLIQVRQNRKKVKTFFKDMREAAHKAWKAICDKENSITRIFDSADKIITNKITAYRAEERRKAAEAQRKAEEERLKRERAEQEKLLKRAEKAEKKGDAEKAEMLLEQATIVQAPPVIVEPTVRKSESSELGMVTGKKDWSVKIIDPKLVIKAVANGLLPETILEIKETRIKQWARQMNIKNYKKDGLEIEQIESLAIRTK